MQRLTVLYDAACALCVRCREWMEKQPAFVELEFLPWSSAEAQKRYRGVPRLGEELVVVSDAGQVWIGPSAFLLCLWALEEWREWSYRLSGPAFAPLARRFFESLSRRRRWIAGWFQHDACLSGTCRTGVHTARPHPYR